MTMLFLRALLTTLLALTLAAPALGGVTTITVQSVADSGDTPSPTDNDFTRINDAVQTANIGDTVRLQGTFDWTEANAAASWALGSDGTAATGDEYWLAVPPKTNLTITADALGDATIQGPGDLASTDLEGALLFFDGSYQGLEVSNLEILDFDLGIGMFFTSSTDFNDAVVTNNRIRMATDLMEIPAPPPPFSGDEVSPHQSRIRSLVAAAAPETGVKAFDGFDESFQNIGIHFSFGSNQTISDNLIEIPGDGVSDTSAPDPGDHLFAASIAMQSNTSGGTVYEGLLIDGNEIHILNAQSADPEIIYGIWENGHAHASNIAVTDNRFVNLAAGNDPALNIQNAFRVTSHSSLSTTVTYAGNEVQGASLGIAQLTGFGGQDFSAYEPIQVLGNTFLDNGTAVLIRSSGADVLRCNRFFGNALAIGNEGLIEDADAVENWFGCNAGPGFGACDAVDSEVDAAQWITMGLESDSPTLDSAETATITVDLLRTIGGGLASCTVPDGAEVDFAAVQGSVVPETAALADGLAETTFTAGCYDGLATVTGLVDGQFAVLFIPLTKLDGDGDGVCDDADVCPGFDDNADGDGDGVPDGCDLCLGDDTQDDSDGDGICDDLDVCPGFDDNVDADMDGVPDGCDLCLGNDASGDTDADAVCDDLDVCPGFDDGVDTDFDGVPDGCDICFGDDATGDGDGDGRCADRDCDDGDAGNACQIFLDAFESGDVSAWSSASP
jgi:hypothetical protein